MRDRRRRRRPLLGRMVIVAAGVLGFHCAVTADDAAPPAAPAAPPAAPPAAQAPQAPQAAQGERMPGRVAMIAASDTATVKAIDPEKRTVTLQTSDGDTMDVKVGKEVRNFDQIRVGDQVRAAAIARLVIAVQKGGEGGAAAGAAARPEEGTMVVRTPMGARPGMIISNTESMPVRVESVDPQKQTVTLKGESGESQTIRVGRTVDLSEVKPGDQVMARVTRGVALWVAPARPQQEQEAQPAAGQIKPEGQEEGFTPEDGGMRTRTATVESVDRDKRTVTLKMQSGASRTIQLGREAVNFEQIRPGDKVHATITEPVAVAVRKGGEGAAGAQQFSGAMIALAPRGGKPGMFIADTDAVNGTIKSIDPQKGTLTITDAEGGAERTVKAGPNVNLSDWKEGDQISARVTRAAAIEVERPS